MLAKRSPKRINLSSPFFQIFVASALCFSASLFLWNSETDAIMVSRSLADAPTQAVHLKAPVIEPVNEGRLVHFAGKAEAQLPLQDPDLDITFEKALVVERKAEMFQWVEVPNGASFKYVKSWSSAWNDTQNFQAPSAHVNPPMQIPSETFVATDAKLGDFTLTEEALKTLKSEQAIAPMETPRGWIRDGAHLYLGLNPSFPAIGDIRVAYRIIPTGSTLTAVARQAPWTLSAYTVANGSEILSLRLGAHSLRNMFEEADPFISSSLWVWRIAATLVLTLCLYAIAVQCVRLFAPRLLTHSQPHPTLFRLSAACAMAITISLISVAWLFRLPFESASALLVSASAIIIVLRYKNEIIGALAPARLEESAA